MGSLDRINNLAYQAAIDLAASSPRADYTPGQLPPLPLPVVSTDQMLFWRGSAGQTYNATVAQLIALITPVVTPATFTQNSFRNKLINGQMEIDQRDSGASVTPASIGLSYGLDRWGNIITQASKYSFQQVAVTPNSGPPTSFAMMTTSLSSYAVAAADHFSITQPIEAQNIQEIAFGTAGAQVLTLSFWARSSLSGNFGGSFANYAGSRAYPFLYALLANTWTYITLTIPGDTAGAWSLTGNGGGAALYFSLGAGATFTGPAGAWTTGNLQGANGQVSVVGTNGATLQITAVQLEVGVAATPLEQRLFGTELDLCQRYCWVQNVGSTQNCIATGSCIIATQFNVVHQFPTTMRAVPTFATFGTSAFVISLAGSSIVVTGNGLQRSTTDTAQIVWSVSSGLTGGQAGFLQGAGSGNTGLVFSAEL